LDWEGKILKGHESGPEVRIPFYLKLQTGEKEFETIKAFIKSGESIGLARKIAMWRFGIQDCLITGAPQQISGNWRERTLNVQCRMRGGDPNHSANGPRVDISDAGTPLPNPIYNAPANQRDLSRRALEIPPHKERVDSVDDRSTSCDMGSTLDSQKNSAQLDINDKHKLGSGPRNQMVGNPQESFPNHKTTSRTQGREFDARGRPTELSAARHDRSGEKAIGRNSVDPREISKIFRSINEGPVEVSKDRRFDVELSRVRFKGAADAEIGRRESKDRQVDRSYAFNSEQIAAGTRAENSIGVEQIVLRIDDVDLRACYWINQFLGWMLSLVRANPKAVMLERAHVNDVGLDVNLISGEELNGGI
jgi:hypothetical protein